MNADTPFKRSIPQPYVTYKETGISWLGEIPDHWQLLPNRALFYEVNRKNFPDEELLSVTIAKGVIRQQELLTNSSKKDSSNENKAKYKLVVPNDIVYNKMRAWQGAIGVSNYRGIVSPAYIIFRLREQSNSNYYHYLFRTPNFAKEAECWSYGITSDQWSLRYDDFKRIYSPLPPANEQDIIVRYLNSITNRINRLIRAKRRMIELLNEQKQAIIQFAVTRGLYPDVPLKPSGVEWLGDIPAHWVITPLRRYWDVIDCKHLTVPFLENGIPLASVAEVQTFELDLSNCKFTSPESYQHLISRGRKPNKGDIIFCRNVSVGASAYVTTDVEFAMGQDVCLIRSTEQNNRFLNYVIHSKVIKEQLERLMVGSTFKRINVEDIRNFTVCIPPLIEQDDISKYLDKHSSQIYRAKTKILQEIDILKEYRIRLISDVVTGKLDVRGAELPALDEMDLIDEIDTGEEDDSPFDEGLEEMIDAAD